MTTPNTTTPNTPERFGPIGNGNAERKLRIAQRREEVARLIVLGVPYRQIGAMLGIGTTTVADDARIVHKGWLSRVDIPWSEHVAAEIAKLDLLEQTWLPLALPVPAEGQQELTAEQVDQAAKAALVLDRIGRRRAKLLGLDAPTRVDVGVFGTPAEEREASMAEKVARGLQLVSEVEAVEDVERQAIEASSRIVGDDEAVSA